MSADKRNIKQGPDAAKVSCPCFNLKTILKGLQVALCVTVVYVVAEWAGDKLSRLLDLMAKADWSGLSEMSNSADYGFGINAAGTDNWRGGLTWVGESGPELVSLPRGSQIYSNQESRGMGGGQYITINVQGIQQLDEVVRWYESRRVVGRMA
jgi:hypothetical protein